MPGMNPARCLTFGPAVPLHSNRPGFLFRNRTIQISDVGHDGRRAVFQALQRIICSVQGTTSVGESLNQVVAGLDPVLGMGSLF